MLIAALPLLLGAHQLDETLVWWGQEGHLPHELGRVAMWVYLTIAFVVLPVVVPLAILLIQRTTRRRWLIAPFVATGTAVATVLLATMVRGPVSVKVGNYHLAYSVGLKHGVLIIGLYVVATCGSLLFSGVKPIVVFGVANLVAVVVLARLTADGFASLWCFYAAVASAAIALHMRRRVTSRADPPYALT